MTRKIHEEKEERGKKREEKIKNKERNGCRAGLLSSADPLNNKEKRQQIAASNLSLIPVLLQTAL